MFANARQLSRCAIHRHMRIGNPFPRRRLGSSSSVDRGGHRPRNCALAACAGPGRGARNAQQLGGSIRVHQTHRGTPQLQSLNSDPSQTEPSTTNTAALGAIRPSHFDVGFNARANFEPTSHSRSDRWCRTGSVQRSAGTSSRRLVGVYIEVAVPNQYAPGTSVLDPRIGHQDCRPSESGRRVSRQIGVASRSGRRQRSI